MKKRLLWALGACLIISWQIKDILSQQKNGATPHKPINKPVRQLPKPF